MSAHLENAFAETQQAIREILTLRQEILKLGSAYDELQKSAFHQLEAEWKEACSDFLDLDLLFEKAPRRLL